MRRNGEPSACDTGCPGPARDIPHAEYPHEPYVGSSPYCPQTALACAAAFLGVR